MASFFQKQNVATIDQSKIRRHFDPESYKWYFSVTDIMAIVTNSADSRNYWKVLKNRLKNTHPQLVTKCNQVKMPANDGKWYYTDAADAKTMLTIIELVSPANVKIFSDWFIDIEKENESYITKNKVVHLKYDGEKSTGQEDRIGGFNKIVTNANLNTKLDEEDEGEILVDLYQNNEYIFLKLLTAGVDPNDIFVSITCKNIFIKGKRNRPGNVNEENYLNQELYWGAFSRTIDFPVEVDIDDALVTEQNGMLTFKIKKLDKLRSKIVKIKSL